MRSVQTAILKRIGIKNSRTFLGLPVKSVKYFFAFLMLRFAASHYGMLFNWSVEPLRS